jgi:predicted transcriptional regulator of viral defense system
MRFLEFRQLMKKFPIFSLREARSLKPAFRRGLLNDWQKKGYIKKIINKHYYFTDVELDESLLYKMANKIYDPSYVSLETALGYHGLIPEAVYGITCVTTRRTYVFNASIARFSFRKVLPGYFFGYNLEKFNDYYVKIASPEKAILDFFYLNSKFDSIGEIEEMRFNKDVFAEKINTNNLKLFLDYMDNKKLNSRIEKLLTIMKNA